MLSSVVLRCWFMLLGEVLQNTFDEVLVRAHTCRCDAFSQIFSSVCRAATCNCTNSAGSR
jgi:hypothetical protein